MIVKKIRESKKLSQEQLAMMSGLSVRTIQRIECGSRASIESLKSIASALETNITALEQEVLVIDKTTDNWKNLAVLFRLNFIGSEVAWLGLSRRDQWIKGEKKTALFGLALIPFGFIDPVFIAAGLFMISIAYTFSIITRVGDQYSIW